MTKLGVSIVVVEKLLNHTSGTLQGVARAYNRFAYRDEMRDAIEQWSKHVAGLISAANGQEHGTPRRPLP
jgi:hypothetical protein